MTEFDNGKRRLLLATAASAAYPFFNVKAAKASHHPNKVLTFQTTVRLYNIHTKEILTIKPNDFALDAVNTHSKVNHFLRDHRANAQCTIDIELISQLCNLQALIENDGMMEVICGYRTKATNKMLRKKSKNVARKSYHMQGRAIDIRAPGTSTAQLRDAAASMQAGGVGYYAKSDFIHLDTGPVRQWG